jgi:phenylacetic acid degradation operon negative regulatory protein
MESVDGGTRLSEAATNGRNGSALQPQQLVITMLGTYLQPRNRRFWSGGLVELLGEFGFSAGAARIALIRLVNRELLERTRVGRLAYYTLTPRSRKLLKEGDSRIFSLESVPVSTDSWTVIWHAIPEDQRLERGRLSRRLRFLGFGALQDGTWVSPHSREAEAVEVIEDLDVQRFCGVLIGTPAEALDFRTFVSRMWPLDQLSERYRAYVKEFKPYARRRKMSDEEAFQVRTRAVHAFREFPALDPQLPDDYMSSPQFRAEAIDVFTTIYERLANPSSRHFDAATEGPIPGKRGARASG